MHRVASTLLCRFALYLGLRGAKASDLGQGIAIAAELVIPRARQASVASTLGRRLATHLGLDRREGLDSVRASPIDRGR